MGADLSAVSKIAMPAIVIGRMKKGSCLLPFFDQTHVMN